jgi:hypothetical protein
MVRSVITIGLSFLLVTEGVMEDIMKDFDGGVRVVVVEIGGIDAKELQSQVP